MTGKKYQGLAWSRRLLCVTVWWYVISFPKQVICCCLCCLTRWKRSKQVQNNDPYAWHVDATVAGADVASHLSLFQYHCLSLNLWQLWFWISVSENHLHYRCPWQTLEREIIFIFYYCKEKINLYSKGAMMQLRYNIFISRTWEYLTSCFWGPHHQSSLFLHQNNDVSLPHPLTGRSYHLHPTSHHLTGSPGLRLPHQYEGCLDQSAGFLGQTVGFQGHCVH